MLFAGVALLVACVVSGRLSAVWVLVAGVYRAPGGCGGSVCVWGGGVVTCGFVWILYGTCGAWADERS